MKISAYQLQKHCQNGLAPVYLIAGDEPLLVQESLCRLRKAAQKAEFVREERFHATANFDWAAFKQALYSPSLFNPHRLIELSLPKPTPGSQGSTVLREYIKKHCQKTTAGSVSSAPNDSSTLLILITSRLDSKAQAASWVKAIDQHGVILSVWPISNSQLPGWIGQQLNAVQLSATPEAISWIAACTEGHLLAAKQVIEKAKLFYNKRSKNRPLTLEEIAPLTHDQGHFNTFSLLNNLLLGRSAHCLRILKHLQMQGEPPTLVLWGVTRHLRYLRELSATHAQNKPLEPLFKAYRIFPTHRPSWQTALKRKKTSGWEKLLLQASYIDQINKGAIEGDSWLALSHIVLGMSQ